LSAAASALAVVLPLVLAVGAAVLYPLFFVFHLIAPSTAADLIASYREWLAALLSPAVLSSLVPRMATLGLLVALVAILGAAAFEIGRPAGRRRARGGFWWRAIGAPVDGSSVLAWATAGFWEFIRGAAHVAQPPPPELSRRYCELVAENLGQPGYRELIILAHDVDARRDLVFALLGDQFRTRFAHPDEESERVGRLSELVDLAGVGREHVTDALGGALSVPGLCKPHPITFAPESHWRGEMHRLCDRPDGVVRLFEEAAAAGATQVIVVSPVASVEGPHALSAARLGLRGGAGELATSAEAAALEGGVPAVSHRFWGIYRISPSHNPLGPFDMGGGFDDRSDRPFTLRELQNRGYEDAYRQFIEPVVGASGETIRTAQPVRTGWHENLQR
jgi:hypothetical protein